MFFGFYQKCFVLVSLVSYKLVVIGCLLVGCFFTMLVSSFICSAFSSKKFVLKVSIFSCGMGFNILGGLSIVGVILHAINVFGDMCRVTGEWSEFRLWSLFVVDVYNALLGVFM